MNSKVYVLEKLKELKLRDTSFRDYEFRRFYLDYSYFTPKQMCLIGYLLKKHNVKHTPNKFTVTFKRPQYREDIKYMEDYQKETLQPYLTKEQRKRYLT